MKDEGAFDGIEPGGVTPTEAFSILGNGTRVAILQALWEGEEPMSFSDLREAVGVDKGNFNYHLNELSHFVRRREGGYELRETGNQVIRAVLTGVITDVPELDPVPIGRPCPFCDSPIELRYEDETMMASCESCAGTSGGDLPRGVFMSIDGFPPAGLAGRSLPEVLEVAHLLFEASAATMVQGVCPECAVETDTEILVCEEHAIGPDGLCESCGRVPELLVEFTCPNCETASRPVLWMPAIYHPAAIALFYERWGFDTFRELQRLFFTNPEYVEAISEEVVSTDPLRVRVEFPAETGRLGLTFDEGFDVVEIERPG
ncbi:winged helix-turn-helix domain-containing protein [Natronorarus salvus]|uniref:winged helix-turn-helix domain-containing protein n=1 Tax=Natronorarus salvus TaxID=3117733 RepID=UPI002F26AAB4